MFRCSDDRCVRRCSPASSLHDCKTLCTSLRSKILTTSVYRQVLQVQHSANIISTAANDHPPSGSTLPATSPDPNPQPSKGPPSTSDQSYFPKTHIFLLVSALDTSRLLHSQQVTFLFGKLLRRTLDYNHSGCLRLSIPTGDNRTKLI